MEVVSPLRGGYILNSNQDMSKQTFEKVSLFFFLFSPGATELIDYNNYSKVINSYLITLKFSADKQHTKEISYQVLHEFDQRTGCY